MPVVPFQRFVLPLPATTIPVTSVYIDPSHDPVWPAVLTIILLLVRSIFPVVLSVTVGVRRVTLFGVAPLVARRSNAPLRTSTPDPVPCGVPKDTVPPCTV